MIPWSILFLQTLEETRGQETSQEYFVRICFDGMWSPSISKVAVHARDCIIFQFYVNTLFLSLSFLRLSFSPAWIKNFCHTNSFTKYQMACILHLNVGFKVTELMSPKTGQYSSCLVLCTLNKLPSCFNSMLDHLLLFLSPPDFHDRIQSTFTSSIILTCTILYNSSKWRRSHRRNTYDWATMSSRKFNGTGSMV